MRLFLFDGSALVHRSFHAFSGRSALTSRERDVGMLFGFLTTLLMVIRREKPDRLAICFDTGAPTFRHRMFDAYKANRPPLDEGIRTQLPLLHDLLDLLHIPQLSLDGYEADDIIGTLARRGAEEGLDVYIVANDKDFLQLVDERIKAYRLPVGRTGDAPEVIGPDGVVAKFGVLPEKVIDVLGMMGDAVDNVPGIPKVGEKTAVELVTRFGGLEEALRRAAEVERPKLRESLTEFADQARLSRQLVIIDTDVPIGASPLGLTFGPLNNEVARKRLAEFEFRSILTQIDSLGEFGGRAGGTLSLLGTEEASPAADEKPPMKRDYRAVTDPARLYELVEKLLGARRQPSAAEHPLFIPPASGGVGAVDGSRDAADRGRSAARSIVSMDTETTAIEPMRAELVGMSFSLEDGVAYYVSVVHFRGVPADYVPPTPPWLRPDCSRELAYILSRLTPVYANPAILKTGQNLKYDLLVLACYDIHVVGLAFDTMLASHLLDPSARQHGIDQLADLHLGIRKIPTSALIGSGARQTSMADVALDKITEYACEDADVALRLTHIFVPKIADARLDRLLYEQELPLLPVLLAMEKTGVALDTRLLGELSVEFRREAERLIEEVQELAGFPFNLNSTQQLADVLYNKMGLPPGRKTKFGYSTDTDELERLAPAHELPAKLLRYRHLTKLKSTYIDALPQMIHPITRRVHTSYSQAIAATGRLSSTDPNIQNIPIRTEEGGRIRKAFIAGEPGWLMLSADYSQIELRIMAHLSGDERMIEAFRYGWDIHRATAAWMNGVAPEEVTSDMRRQAKEVNFGVLYGMGDFGLAQRLGISRARAKEFIDQYFSNFAGVRRYIDELHAFARRHEYVETMMGRRRPVPDINSKNFNIRSNAERVATNTPIQGSAADLMKLAMINVHNALRNEGFRARMLLQVHDELVFEAPPEEVERLSARLKEIMAGAMELIVPLEVGVGWGGSWLDAHD